MKTIRLIDGGNLLYKSFYHTIKIIEPLDDNFNEQMQQEFVNKYLEDIVIHGQNVYTILALDSPNWRSQLYEEYKSGRIKHPILSTKEYKTFINTFQNDINELTPIDVVRVDNSEADDIISVIILNNKFEKIFLVSSDKDFWQLQLYVDNITQISPVTGDFISGKYNITEHILIGDSVDNIKPVWSGWGLKKLDDMVNSPFFIDELNIDKNAKDRFLFNKQLIDLREIPNDIINNIQNTYLNINKKANMYNLSIFADRYHISNQIYFKLFELLSIDGDII